MKIHSVKYNFIMNIILTMSSFIFPLITFPYVSRILFADGMGKISFATSLVAYFIIISQMGIPTYGIRACAKVRDNKELLNRTVSEIFIINLIMTILSYIFLVISILLVPKLYEMRYLILIISSSILFNLIGIEWLYKGLEQYGYITARSVVFKLIAMILMFVLIKDKDDYLIYGFLTILASSASYILNFINARKFVKFRIDSKTSLKKHFKPILVFFAMSCAVTIYTNLDTLMLGFIKNDTEVGLYNVAIKVRTVLLSVITSLGTVLLPRASYYIEKKNSKKFNEICKKAIHFVIIVSIPTCLFFSIYSRETILILSGEGFLDGVYPMIVLMPTIIFAGLSNITGIQMLIPLNKEKYVLYSEIMGAIVDLILNSLLIPKYSCIGAAIATTIAEIFVLLYQMIILKKLNYNFLELNFKNILSIIIGSLIGIPILIIIGNVFNNIILKFIIAAILYFLIYIFSLMLFKDKLVSEIIDELIKKIRRNRIEEN